MGERRAGPLVLDSGALIAFERQVTRVVTMVETATQTGGELHIPAPVVAQVWRNGPRHARLARLLNAKRCTVHPLDGLVARLVGALCAEAGTADVVDGHVALVARQLRATVITSDPDDIARLAPELTIKRC